MKKQIVLATIATLATTSVYATKARMSALGQATDKGSFYIDDTRNKFRNAAFVNRFNNYVVAELGDAAGTPNAEAGIFRNAGSFVYGLYFGADAYTNSTDNVNYSGTAADVATGAGGFNDSSNEFDLFFGGDAGVEWGVRLHRAANDNKTTGGTEKNYENMNIGLGILMGDLGAYANFSFKDEAEYDGTTVGSKWEGEYLNIGANYKMMDWTFYADYNKVGSEYNTGVSGAALQDGSTTTLTVGAGHIKEISSTSRWMADVSFKSIKGEENTTNQADEQTQTQLPVNIGFETDATSWLTVRASVKQNFFLNDSEVKDGNTGTTTTTETSGSESTAVAAGMTLNFGKFMIDGTLETTTSGKLNANQWMSNVSVHYWF